MAVMPPRSREPKPCTFCAIIAGDVAADIVAAEPHALAFLDGHPLFFGHVLVVPRRHVKTLGELPADDVPALFRTVQRIDRAVQTALDCDGSLVLNNNVVSQSVPHLHIHVIPRNRGDGLRFWLGPRHRYGEGAAADYAARIATAYAEHPRTPG
jgi:histidine triad (HIT) family protein